jgi:tRNA (guanine26-N2/guanine27-N2)-dimethyltransferase
LGPIWTGKVQDREFCKKLLKEFVNSGFRNRKGIEMSCEEIDHPFYYDIHKICKLIKINPPKIDRVIKELKDRGFDVSRTHFCLTGIKTDAGIKELVKTLKRLR